MTTFLSDLWADLREKRLWPVALLLLVAVVAVPVVLAKPDAEPAPAPPAPPSEQSDADSALKVIAAANDVGEGSPLNLFDKEDPFRPPKQALAKADEADGAADTVAGPDQGADTTGEAIGEAGEAGKVAPPAGSGGGTTGGDTTGGGQSDGDDDAPTKPTTKRFTYVIDATFKRGNRTRKIKGMERLEMLPNEDSPLLLFLGVDAHANNAVFLVDSRLDAQGEGTCKPRPSECSFLYLGAGSQHMFSEEDGTTYLLRIDQIRRVKLGDGDSAARAGKAKRGDRKAHGSASKRPARSTSTRRPFLPPFLADLVTVTRDSYEASSSTDARR